MPSLRDALATALDTERPEDEDTSQQPVETGSVPEAAPAAEAAPTEEAPQEGDTRVRDALGRFVPKDPAAPAPEAQKPAAVPQPGTAPQPGEQPAPQAQPAERAPVSVPPALREHWQALPEGFRQYTLQREQQVQVALQQSAEARRFAGEFSQMMQPYLPFMRAEGAEPMQAVQNLMDIAVTLRTGTAAEKARTIAQIVGAYGVDIAALDSALAGVAPDPAQQGFDPSLVQREVQRALSPLVQQAEARRAQMEQRTAAEVQSEIAAFAEKHEFFADLRMAMADMMDVAEAQGRKLTLEEAYEAAAYLNPEIRRVMLAREQAKSAQSTNATAQRAKAAAVQVKGTGAEVTAPAADTSSVRAAIEAALEATAR